MRATAWTDDLDVIGGQASDSLAVAAMDRVEPVSDYGK